MILFDNSRVIAVLVVVAVAWVLHHVFLSAQGPILTPPPTKRLARISTTNDTKLLWAFVTGGTSGIGQGFALDLLARGYSVVVSGTSEQTVKDGVAYLNRRLALVADKPSPPRVEGVVMTVGNVDQAKETLERIIATRDLRIVVSLFPLLKYQNKEELNY